MSIKINSYCEELILLIGSNPLPNYLSALVLNPKKVYLMYTDQTESIMANLASALGNRLPGLDITEKLIGGDGTNAREVEMAIKKLPDNANLNYTGGTKIMAAHARMNFKGEKSQASYLDERNDVLRFDDGNEEKLSGIGVPLEDILKLHGISTMDMKPKPSTEEATRIAKRVLLDLESKKCEKGDEWLEVWTGEVVKNCIGLEPTIGLTGQRIGRRQLEIDVLMVRGHKMYAISCTTKEKIAGCKGKLLEIAIRARQLGGDLARAALVCLLHGDDQKGDFVDQLRNDVADVWDATNTPEVFGLDDLREWNGNFGAPNTRSLKKWLES
jgi:hypothetical protein